MYDECMGITAANQQQQYLYLRWQPGSSTILMFCRLIGTPLIQHIHMQLFIVVMPAMTSQRVLTHAPALLTGIAVQ
jgi:hypothetical protein